MEKHQKSFEMTKDAFRRMAEVKEHLGMRTDSELIRRAINEFLDRYEVQEGK